MNYYQIPWLAEVRFLIFDLECTLYLAPGIHRMLIAETLTGTRYEAQIAEAVDLADRILAGRDGSRLPEFVRLRSVAGSVSATEYPAAPESTSAVESAFLGAQRIPFDEPALTDIAGDDPVCLADGWSVAQAVLRLFKLPADHRRSKLYSVRRSLLAQLTPHSGLNAALCSSTLYKVLQTDLSQESACAFVDALLEPASFHEILCDAGKPRGLYQLITRLIHSGVQPPEILSIGDHPWNDLKPARVLGCRTVLVSPYEGMSSRPWDVRLRTLEELGALVRACGYGGCTSMA